MASSWALNFVQSVKKTALFWESLLHFSPCGVREWINVIRTLEGSGVSVNDSESKIIEDQLFFCFSSFISTVFPNNLLQVSWFVSESFFLYCHHWPWIYSSSGSLFKGLLIKKHLLSRELFQVLVFPWFVQSLFQIFASERDSVGILHCLFSASALYLKFWTDVSLALCWVFYKACSVLLQYLQRSIVLL